MTKVSEVSLNPLSKPVALNPIYVTKKTENLHMKSNSNGNKWTITLEDGTPLFHIDGSCMSMSSKRTIEDAQGNPIYQCQLDKQVSKKWKQIYSAQSLDGSKLWEMKLHTKFSGTETEINFANSMNGGQMEQLNYKAHTYSSKKYVMYQGQEVAFIKRRSWSMKQEYDITIAQGMDMTLIIPIVLAVDDRVRASNTAAIVASA